MNLKLHLLSGDDSDDVEFVAREIGINNVVKKATVEDKLDYIKSLQNKGGIVMMVGDGINDAPALSMSQVSVAMGSGADLTKINADSVLLGNNLSVLAQALESGYQTRTIIKQNITWALGYNLIGILAASLGLIPPYLAALGMSCSSLIVIFNSLRLNKPRQSSIIELRDCPVI